MHKSIERLLIALGLLTFSIILGIIGFMMIEHYNLLDAFYMTVITFSTVGFTEVHPLSTEGRLFTGAYIIMNFGIFAYIVSVITSYFFEGELQKIFKNYMTNREVKKMKDHVIVCGFGRNGMKACEELYSESLDFVVIEKELDEIAKLPVADKYQFIQGDATLDETLKEAGIERASNLILTLPKDTDNVFIALTAKDINPTVNIISRASEGNSEKKLHRAGASSVIMPDALGGLHMAQLVTKPYVIEFLEMLNGIGDSELTLEEFGLNDFMESFQGKTLKDMHIRNKTGVTIIAFKDGNQGFHFNPSPNKVVDDDDVLIALGTRESLLHFRQIYCR